MALVFVDVGAEAAVDVIVKVSDSSGQEVFHAFKVAVKDGAAPR